MLRRLARLLRWTAGGFTALVLLAIAALAFTDLSRHRAAIESAVEAALGREVSIEGAIGIVPSLPPALAVENVRIDNVDWARDTNLLTAKELRFSLSMTALLRGSVSVTEVEARGFELSLESRDDGPPSWRIGDGEPLRGAGLRVVTLDDGVVRYRTPARSIEVELSRLRARLSEDGIGIEVEARLGEEEMSLTGDGGRLADLHAGEAIPLSWRWRLGGASASGDGSLRLEGQHASFEGRYQLDIPALAELSGLTGRALPDLRELSSRGTLEARWDRLELVVRDAKVATHSAQGALVLDLAPQRPMLQASIKMGEVQLAALPMVPPSPETVWVDALPGAIDLDVRLSIESLVAGGAVLGPAEARLSVSQPIGRLSIDLGAPTAEVSVDLSIDATPDAPRAALVFETGPLNGGAVLEFLGMKSTAFAPRVASARGELRGSGADLESLLRSAAGSLHLEGLEPGHSARLPASLGLGTLDVTAEDGRLTHLAASGRFAGEPFALEATGGGPLLAGDISPGWPIYVIGSYGNAGLEARGTVANPLYAWAADLQLTAQSDDLRGAGNTSTARVPLRLRTRFKRDANELELSALDLSLGASRFQGRVKRIGSPGHWEVVLQSESAAIGELFSWAAALTSNGALLPAWLPEAKAYLRLELRSLAETRAVSDIHLDAELAGGVMQVEPMGFRLGDATARATAVIDARKDTLSIRGHARTDNLDIARLLGAPLSASASSAALSVRTSGLDLAGLLSNLEMDLTASGLELRLDDQHPSLSLADGRLSLEETGAGANGLIEGRIADSPVTIELESNARLLSSEPKALELNARSPGFSAKAKGSVESVSPARFALELEFDGKEPSGQLGLGHLFRGPYSGRARVNADRGTLSVWGLAATVGESDVGGSARLAFADPGRYEISLSSQRIVVPSTEREEAAPADANATVIPALPLANLFPEGWSGELDWQIGSLAVTGHEYRNIVLDAAAREGHLYASLSGDSPQTDGRFRATLERPSAGSPGTLVIEANGADAGWLFRKSDPVRWPADIDLTIEGPVGSLDELLRAGSGELFFSAGKTLGQAAQFERWQLDLLSAMLPSLGPAPKDEIECLVANVSLRHGTARSDRAVLQTKHVTVAAGGSLDLASERLDLVLSPRPNDTKLLSMATPVQLGGTLASPEIAAAPGAVVLSAGKLLLDTANPLNLLGALVPLGRGDDRCGLALPEARRKTGSAPQGTDSNETRESVNR